MVYIDDSIMQKGHQATAGSKMLENFTAPFDATVITRLTENTERVALAEFGMGDPGELPGAPMLCNDVFGHVRQRAARQGLCYIRPTYGTVSRFGLIPTASSMDQIGVVCQNPSEGFSLLSAIAGHDQNDGAMFPEKSYNYQAGKQDIKWSALLSSNKESALALETFIQKIGVTENLTDGIGDYADVGEQILQILSSAEVSNNISRYDGIKFGRRASSYRSLEDLYTKTRTEAFGLETKLASIMGSLVLSQDYYSVYYEKAMKIRRLIKKSLRFDQYDVLVLPVDSPLAVLAGLPSLTFSHDGADVQLAADIKNESILRTAWEAIQS